MYQIKQIFKIQSEKYYEYFNLSDLNWSNTD